MGRADWVLLLATVAWGATFVLVQDAIAIMPPFTFIGVRFIAAAILIAPLVLRQHVAWRSPKLWWAGASVGIWLSLGYILQTFGLLYTSAARAGFITGLSVLF
ncbi:MAG: EamA family transporter [Synechococcaceae cyanobacterium SM2_3_60]|nr:EamA family transporter [Synechococcaceae cyanobacterium SM2_3_60]